MAVKQRRPRAEVQPFVSMLCEQLPETGWNFGGSWRRGAPEIGDLDVMMLTDDGTFRDVRLPPSFTPSRQGPQLLSGILELPDGSARIQLDMWAAMPQQAGAFLMFVTGPARLNILQRNRALHQGLKLSQYGLFHETGEFFPAFTELEVYQALNMDWLTPEERQRFAPAAQAAGAKTQTWHVHGTKDMYTVTRRGDSWRCERADGSGLCLGFKFSREHPAVCKHVREVREKHGA